MIAEPKKPAVVKRPTITLISDFGARDYFVGAMKGAIHEINPNAAVIDISHEIAPFDLLAAAFTLRACYYDFPLHTIHVVAVDPATPGAKRRPLLVKTENFYFIAPDNGVLSFIFACERLVGVWAINATHYYRPSPNPNFYARDIYAPVAAHLSRVMSGDDFGEPIQDFARIPLPKPEVAGKQVKGRVLLADRFGNLITNVEFAELAGYLQAQGLKRGQVSIAGKSGPLVQAHGEGQGEIYALPGPTGHLEICAQQKSAEKLVGAQRGQEFLLQLE